MPTELKTGHSADWPNLATTPPWAVLVADPPWQHRDALGLKGAASKYRTMSTREICALELPERAERAVLFLWRVASMVEDALEVIRAWGFVPCAELVWIKRRPCRTCCATGRVDVFRIGGELVIVPGTDRACPECRDGGADWIGMGSYTRGEHETCVIARPKSGRAPERLDLGVKSTFEAPLLLDVDGLLGERGRLVHSAKPDAFFRIVERLYPGPRVELFSRRRREGWITATSDQPDRLDEVARVMRDVWPARERAARLEAARRRA